MKKQIILLGAVLLSASSFAQEWLSNTTTIYNNPLTKSVGIGTTTAVDKLHVIGGIRSYQNGLDQIQPQLYLGNGANTRAFSFQLNSSGSSLNFWAYNGSSWSNKFTFKNDGYFGINTPSPIDQIHVYPQAGASGITITQNQSGYPSVLTLHNGNTGGRSYSMRSTGSGDPGGIGNFMIYDNGNYVPRLFIKGSQNGQVGLGTTDPFAYFHIKGADHGHGLIVEPGNTNVAYGTLVRAKNNLSKSFVVENSVGTPNEPFIVYGDGKTRIGPKTNTIHPDAFLTVDGKIVCKEVYVTDQNWADFVFAAEYKLPSLKDVEAFYKLNKHLPEIPSAKEVEEKGVSVGEMNKLLLQKIEELTIYLVEQQKEIDALKLKFQSK